MRSSAASSSTAACSGYSPLSRLVELEGLRLGVEGKACLWRMLRELGDPRLRSFDFDDLIARAERQRDDLERWRLDSGQQALRAGG